jgi:hypothetical protein
LQAQNVHKAKKMLYRHQVTFMEDHMLDDDIQEQSAQLHRAAADALEAQPAKTAPKKAAKK